MIASKYQQKKVRCHCIASDAPSGLAVGIYDDCSSQQVFSILPPLCANLGKFPIMIYDLARKADSPLPTTWL